MSTYMRAPIRNGRWKQARTTAHVILKQTKKKIIPGPLDSIRRSILSSSSSNLSALFCTDDNNDATDPDETDGNCKSRSKLEVVASTNSSRFLDDSSPNLHSWTGRRCSRIDCSCL